jgi:predicted DsbA family dithiol-disulfide isomerase
MLPHMQQVGLQHGIKFTYGGKIGNTINSHRLVEYAKRHGKENEMVDIMMKGYFEEEQDVSDVATLVKLAGKAGLNTDEVLANH